jgi:prepilin peptidase CpaA
MEGSLLYTWIDLFCITIAAGTAAVAAATDYRTLRIPNRLTFPVIFGGLVIVAFRCVQGYPLPRAALTCAASYAFVYGLWKCRMWGGGDAKLVLALFILASPAYPPLYFIAAFSICLALVLILKHGVYKPARRTMNGRPVAAMKGGPLSAEDIASLKEAQEPMGPALFVAYVLSIVLMEAMSPW